MKKEYFVMITLLFGLLVTLVGTPDLSIAQEHAHWGLPEGAKARIGKGWLYGITYSSDGSLLAVAGSTGTWIYDADTLKEQSLLRVWDGVFDSNSLTVVGKSFDAFGYGSPSDQVHAIYLYDAVTGVQKASFDSSFYFAYAYSSVSNLLAVGGFDGIVIWDTETRVRRDTITGHRIESLAFSPDGTRLAGGGEFGDPTVHLWDVSRPGTRLQATLAHEDYDEIDFFAFSPDGNRLAVGGGGHGDGVSVWEVRTGQLETVLEYSRGETYTKQSYGYPSALVFSPDGSMIAHSSGSIVSLWETETWEQKVTLNTPGYHSSVHQPHAVAYSPDGTTLAVGQAGHAMLLWDVAKISSRIREHDETFHDLNNKLVLNLRWSPEYGNFIEGDAMLIDTAPRGIHTLAYLTDGATLLVNGYLLWDVTTGSRKGTLSDSDGATVLRDLVSGPLSLDGHSIEVIRDLTNGVVPVKNSVRALAYSPDGNTLATAQHVANDWNLQLWDPTTGRLIRAIDTEDVPIADLAYSPDGTILTTSIGSTVTLWHAGTGERLREIGGGGERFAYSPDGNTLAMADGAVIDLYDTQKLLSDRSSLWVERVLEGHTGYVTDLVYSPDGTTLASGSEDGTVLFWDLSDVAPFVGEWVNLDAHDLSLLPNIKSGDNAIETAIIFVNGTEAEIAYYWIDSAGNEALFARIPAGTSIKQQTFAGHFWLLKDHNGRNLALFEAKEKIGRVTIGIGYTHLPEDVNSDGVVNIQDLVAVAAALGETGESPADVNGDGVVNIQDLVAVAAALGETAAGAPSAVNLPAETVQQWLTTAAQLNLTDPISQRGIRVLEELLRTLAPKETLLLANYPNPFNPETWIPYQLSKPAVVTLDIYSVDGKLVRTLALGHQAAGVYQSRSRAAYWDGKNNLGESVASGLYFYTLTAGEFTATRKMVIRK